MNFKRWMWWAIPLVVAAVTVAATWVVLSWTDGGDPTPKPTPVAEAKPPESGGRYESPADVVGALEKAGALCENFEEIDKPINAISDGRCHSDVGSDDEVVVRIYASHADALDDAQDSVDFAATTFGDYSIAAVVGENWSVRGHHDYIEDVQASLGGDLVEVT